MALEIERKFLITDIPFVPASYPHKEIMQGYFLDEGEKVVRLRKKGNDYFLTRKRGHGLSREEHEEELSASLFEELRNNIDDRYLEKTRYEIPYQGATIELDVYKGKLHGLIVAEVEFTSEKDAKSFTPPERFGKELTEVREASNAYLAKYGNIGL